MNSPEELRGELLDDFYAECDELLTAIRAGLTQLENAGNNPVPDPVVVEALFRGTHSLKGNAAIVGLRSAEEVAHAMEDVLRALGKRETAMSEATLEALLAATQQLEKIVTAHRLKKTLPEIPTPLLEQLRQLHPKRKDDANERPTTAALTPPEAAKPDPIAAAQARNLHVYRVSFSPSRALEERGVNVKSVRERLSGFGEILSAAPSVRGKGIIVFEFVVGFRAPPPPELAAGESDGIQLVPAGAGPAERPSGSEMDMSGTLSLAPSHMVRVDLARLDELMRITGEMVIQRSRLEDRLQQNGNAYAGFRDINLGLSRSLRDMRAAITRVRMVPIAEIFARMPFVVRDLMSGSGKKVRVALEGNQTEVDKYLVERLKEPLLHLVRNAFAHGVEPAAERGAAGKPAEATITLRAKSVGESVVIQIRDDGRGIDANAVVARAGALGLKVPAIADTSGILKILCMAGFSTRDEADRAAGRGVGMAVVSNAVRELGGLLTLETWPGQGTEFTLKLPLTLSIAEAIIVNVGPETCAVPQSAVEEIVEIAGSEVRAINQSEIIPYRGGLLPLVRLRRLFGAPVAESKTVYVLVIGSDRSAAGLVVDRVRSQREVVIRRLADPLLRVPGISGATELGDGRPILILDPTALIQGVMRPPETATLLESQRSEIHAS